MDFCCKTNPALLSRLLRYDRESGFLFWRERPLEMFKDIRSFRSWNSMFAGKPALHTLGNHGYRRGKIYGVELLAHRAAWAVMNGAWPDGEIDHIDGNRLNNRADNLRDVSRVQNGQNLRRSSRNTSGRSGVSFNKLQGKWVAYIQVNGVFKYLGTHKTKDEAIVARRAAEIDAGFHANHGRG